MEMYQVRYVLAAAKSLNFTRAAEECNVSQPALTKAVKLLEDELGAPLFHREGKSMLLSEFGKSLLPNLESILEQAEATRTLAENFRLMRRVPVRLGVMSTVGHLRLSRFLAKVHKDYPGVEIAVSESSPQELRDGMEKGELDLAVMNAMGEHRNGLTIHDLYQERYVVVFPQDHHLSKSNSVRLAELSDEPYVDRLSCEMRELVMGVCKANGVNLYARFRSQREDWVQAMVLARIGFAFMPECSVTMPGLLQRPLVEPEVARTVSICAISGRQYSPATSALVRAARTYDWLQ